MKYLKQLFNFVPKGVSFIWGYVSKYITPTLLILCTLFGYGWYSINNNATLLKEEVYVD